MLAGEMFGIVCGICFRSVRKMLEVYEDDLKNVWKVFQ